MPNGHTVKIGDEWVDGMLVGRAAALAEWKLRKEIDDPEFEKLIDRLRQRRYWANLDEETKERIRFYRSKWREENPERYRAAVNEAKRRGRKSKAHWYMNELERKREKFKAETQRMREEVHTCVWCGCQFCIGLGRIPPRRPKYCDNRCRAKANHARGKARGAAWAKRDKTSSRAGKCIECGKPTSRAGKKCSECHAKKT